MTDETYLTADGFDAAIIGIAHPWQNNQKAVAIYDAQKCIDILVANGADYEEAMEHFEFNVAGSYVGDQSPIFVWPRETE
jgi:hypothetical protein